MARDLAAGEISRDLEGHGDASSPPSVRLIESLEALSQAVDSGDLAASDAAVAAVVELLDAAAADGEAARCDGDAADASSSVRVSEELLREIYGFLSSPSSNQMAADALSLELPKVMAKLGVSSDNCRQIAADIIEFFISTCSPRDMLSIICEALDTQVEVLKEPAYFVLLFDGLARVLNLIQRRRVEQVKVALPIVLKVLYAIPSECHGEQNIMVIDLFKAAIGIGNSIQEICKIVVDRKKEELCAILGLYAIQNIALISRSIQQNVLSTCGSLVLQLSKFLPFCGFSYFGLFTGYDVTSATDRVSKVM